MKQQMLLCDQEEIRKFISETIREEFAKSNTEKVKSHSHEYLTREETANKLRISKPTLTKYTMIGIIKGYRLSGRILYKEDEIEKSLKEIQSMKYSRKVL